MMLLIVPSVVGCGSTSHSPHVTTTRVPGIAQLNRALVTQGRHVYLQNCASCHGANAEGAINWEQPNTHGDMPPPPHNDSGHTWRHSDAQLTMIIQMGMRDYFNKSRGLTMPAFGRRLTKPQFRAVITYFKSLWSPEHRRYQEEQNRKARTS